MIESARGSCIFSVMSQLSPLFITFLSKSCQRDPCASAVAHTCSKARAFRTWRQQQIGVRRRGNEPLLHSVAHIAAAAAAVSSSSSSLAYIFIPLLLSLPTQLLQYGGAKDRTWAGRAHCTATQRTWRQAFRLGRWGKPSDENCSHSRSDLFLVGTLLLLVSQAIFDSPQLECRKYILFYINLVCIWTYQSCIDSCKRTVGKHVGLAEREQDRPVSRSNQWQQIATSVSSSRVFIDIGRQCHRRTRRRRVCLEDIPMDGRQLLAQDRCWWMPCLYWTTGIRWIYIYIQLRWWLC